jgi:hypothetical protein
MGIEPFPSTVRNPIVGHTPSDSGFHPMAEDQDRKPFVHELAAAPFHINRPWHDIEADIADVPDVSGGIIVLCSDGIERQAARDGPKISLFDHLPDGVTVKAWRQI